MTAISLGMSRFNVLSLFAGIGGFDLGLERASPDFKTVAFCEIDPYNQAILRSHWPEVKQYEDVRILDRAMLARDGIRPNAIVGGFPCQDASSGNEKGLGASGPRTGLFREIVRLASILRPEFILMENVGNLLGRGFGDVLGALAEIGYDAEWEVISAADAGAEHERERLWILAYPMCQGWGGLVSDGAILGRAKQALTRSRHPALEGWRGLANDISALRDDNGLSLKLERRRLFAAGNAIVPQIAEEIGRQIMLFSNNR